MNDSFSRILALLAVWMIALLPLFLIDRGATNLVAALVSAHSAADVARP